MSFQLVIAEKPSVARSIAAVIGATEKQNGYWQGGGYLVSWCIGHLVSFAEAGQYDEKYCKWKYEDLPILPQPWQFIVPDEKKQQFEVLRALLNRPDVDSVTAATDAGREGELIFRFVYQMAGCTKPVKRLWISSMEDAAIREGFANLRPDSDYNALYQSALCRAKADWLVGINATRLFSVLYHKTLTVGRVQTPTLKMLVDRDAKILRFQKEKYYTVGIQSGSLKAGSGRIASMDEADTLRQACAGASAICSSVKREKKTEQPPKLYDLTTLQREANRLFGFTAKQTLDYAQQLYEKKLLTYPRTDSQYLTEDMGQTVQHLVSDLLGLLPFAQGLDLTPKVDRVLNSKKVSDHHAILPTAEFAKQGFTGFAESECKLLNLVCSKLLCAIAAPHEYETVTAVFSCAGNEFTAKGKTVLILGWKEIDQRFRSTMKADGEEEAESLTSPALTAEWENRLTEIAKGNADPDEFMAEIEAQVRQLVKTYSCISADKQNLFQSERVIIGKCPRCSENVYEGKKNFYCGNRSCQFVMWKNDRFFEQRKKAFTPKIAAALLKNGKAKVKGLYSEKTGKTYDATVLLADTGGKYVNYRVERKE